jgi:hypothetical protein
MMTTRSRTRRREQADTAPGLALVADRPDLSRFVRLPGATDHPSARLAKAIEDAVHAGIIVEIFAADGDLAPAFSLRVGRGALQIFDGEGEHLGVFATASAAVVYGWERSRAKGLK